MIEAETRDLVLTNDQLEKVSAVLLNEFNRGLAKETNKEAIVRMYPTYVRDVPNGNEEGQFLSLDLGGTNFRVLLIELKKDYFKMENEIYAIPEEIMLGSGVQLFDRIAECLANFMEKQNVKQLRLPLGFTFSFPCIQEGLTVGRLVRWTKGFNCEGVVGEDVVKLLREAIQRRGDIDIDVMAVVNDTTGTLMSCAHKNRQCRVGLIVGTGANACYMEKLENVGLWNEDYDEPKQVIINTEWGAFGDNGVLDFVRTEWDDEIDRESLNPGKQLFEKMISGMYMGELVRCVLVTLTKKGLVFNGVGSEKLFTARSFHTAYVSWVESDNKNDYSQTRKALEKMNIEDASDEDCEAVKMVCTRVSTRAAYLVSAAVATILNKMQRPQTTVGVDGSVYRYHPHFHDLMVKKVSEMTNPEYKVNTRQPSEGNELRFVSHGQKVWQSSLWGGNRDSYSVLVVLMGNCINNAKKASKNTV